MELLYTHGDMVHSLPDFAVSLGGNTNVPIEACAYILFIQRGEESISEANTISTTQTATTKAQVQPYAVTFQAHPEYISPTYRIQRELYQYSSINGGSWICRTTNVKGGL